MSDTGHTCGALSPRHAAFVIEYMKDRSATAAAQRAGYSVRSAASLMAMQPIKDEIVRRTDALVTESKVPLHQSLLAEAEQARQVAEEAGNASAMVAALRLKAELTNQLDASAKSTKPVQCGTAELARSLIGLFLEYGYKLKLEPLQPGEAYDIDRALRAMNRPPRTIPINQND